MKLKVKDYRKFDLFGYVSNPSEDFQLGQILYRETTDGVEIGVVIQILDGEARTDEWGWGCNVRPATYNEVKKYRPNLVKEIDPVTIDLRTV